MDPRPEQPLSSTPHRRRTRYSGKYPRKFVEKYKELDPERYGETMAKVLASGKTPAGTHRPIMSQEILGVLSPKPGEIAVDCTLGYGGHSEQILPLLQPGGRLLGLDADPLQLPKTEARLRSLGWGLDVLITRRTNFGALQKVLVEASSFPADAILADLGVSSMQLDDPARGFSYKETGPLDMRMNPQREQTAAALLRNLSARRLSELLRDNSEEPHAEAIAGALAGQAFTTTTELAGRIWRLLSSLPAEARELSIRRVFQALRIAVNDEFSALESLLRQIPQCLKPGGRVAVLSFHSGEDRRIKDAFARGLRSGYYTEIAEEVIRPSPSERHDNPRSTAAKLRWARKGNASQT